MGLEALGMLLMALPVGLAMVAAVVDRGITPDELMPAKAGDTKA